jgi:hypothetical protein
MKHGAPPSISNVKVDALMTHTVPSESQPCTAARNVQLDKVPSGTAAAPAFMEEE